ncbi:uncharacterized protein B0H18DRAFT_1108321 [Fomitopsis serialis]|uniref:uncharacterized protein n=1 Tax=Fomitopsis serialis TaxID=139415 RepID=UPI002008DC12|nr:uncharacterized protein B0H18DRAFT_1108321 [Neoantrodia serialis]KAH9914467.1 hypothetical protein B0H18DRAFT_1108321 [Neoantrodia serialis]
MTSAPATILGWMSNIASGSKAWPTYSSTELRASPSLSDMQRQPYYRTHSHMSATSERRAQRNRERDPSWVPRPPNAFIIFRSEYSRKHAQANRNNPPTPEKTLSKRAAEAWKALSVQEKAPYKEKAEQERLDHAEKHPHYRYKPRRRQSDGQQETVAISRREQVESLVRRTATRSEGHSSESESASDYTSASSPAFLYLSGASAAWQRPSVPTGVKMESFADSLSPYDLSPFAWPIEPLDAGFNLWSSDPSAGFASPSTSSVHSAPDAFTFDTSDIKNEDIAIPQLARPPTSTSAVSSSVPTSTSPLLRRRRAATASGAFPSPLTMVTSSLSGWNTMPVPTVTVSGVDPTAESPAEARVPTQTYVPPNTMQSWPNEAFVPAGALATPVGEVDFDRTPRSSEFPVNARPRPTSVAANTYSGIQADIESYTMGLTELGIEPGNYSMSPFGNLDINEFFNFDADVAAQG